MHGQNHIKFRYFVISPAQTLVV